MYWQLVLGKQTVNSVNVLESVTYFLILQGRVGGREKKVD